MRQPDLRTAAVFLPVVVYLLLRLSGWLGAAPGLSLREILAFLLAFAVAAWVYVLLHRLVRRAVAAAEAAARVDTALQAAASGRAHAEEDRERFFDLSLDMLCIAGFDGYFKQLNPAWEHVLGWTLPELTALPFVDFIHPEDREPTSREMQRLRVGGSTVDFENRYRMKDGSWRWLSWRAAALPERSLVYAVARDVHERKKIDQLKSDFVSVVSHELRTPLTSISGSLGLLAGGAGGPLPDKAGELVGIAARNSERLVRLISDILDVEKIESGQMSFRFIPQPLMPLVEQAIESNRAYAQRFNVDLQLKAAVPTALVRVDADRIQQVLANLLSNASKFSPRGGVVEVAVTRLGDLVRVAVTDRGPGIPKDFQPFIFERFAQADVSSTRQKGGTGLGLSISKAIVERHGGWINFLSVPHEGTTFWFELPEWSDSGRA